MFVKETSPEDCRHLPCRLPSPCKVPGPLVAVAVTLATPAELVTAVGLDRVAVAPPLLYAVKFTITPPTGLPALSVAVTCSGVAKGFPDAADCGVPAVAVRFAGTPPTE